MKYKKPRKKYSITYYKKSTRSYNILVKQQHRFNMIKNYTMQQIRDNEISKITSNHYQRFLESNTIGSRQYNPNR